MTDPGAGTAFLARLAEATNSHDVDRVADCFTADYANTTPTHPARGFEGREQVRRNWTQIFAGVPDLTAAVLSSAQSGDETWSEWEMRGHRVDGAEHLMRGVIIFGVAGDEPPRACSARFYLEPVDREDLDADRAVRQVLGGTAP
jgi:ketosteroid isomerase-like protein